MIPTREQIDEIACIEQRTPDWFRARLGCITGSNAHFVMKLSDAGKAVQKAIEAGKLEVETKAQYNARLKMLKETDPAAYGKAVESGRMVETDKSFNERIERLKTAENASPFPDTTIAYLYQVAAERNLRDVFVKDDDLFEQYLQRTTITSIAMKWGTETEAMARLQYQRLTGREVVEIGFHRHPTVDWYGDSPDGIVVDSESGKPLGGIEIKCPKSETWLRYRHEFRKAERQHNEFVKAYAGQHPDVEFAESALPEDRQLKNLVASTLKRVKPEYYWQCQSHCACCELDWCDFVFYDQMQYGEIGIVRIYRNDDDINAMLQRIELANKFIDNEILA